MHAKTIKETDQQLREAVLRHLDWEPEVVSTDISVAADDGMITLTGFVHTYAEKFAAGKAAQSVYGVKAVVSAGIKWVLPHFR